MLARPRPRELHCGAGLGRWASSKDPILQRYGVGALSRVATSSPNAFRAVVDSGCLPSLVAATVSDDAQAQCFAAGAIGVPLSHALRFMEQRPDEVRCPLASSHRLECQMLLESLLVHTCKPCA